MDTATLKQETESAAKELMAAELVPLSQPEDYGTWIAEALAESLKMAVKYAQLYDRLQATRKTRSAKSGKRIMPGHDTIHPTRSVVDQVAAPISAAKANKASKVEKADSRTAIEIRQYLMDAKPPFTSGKIFRGLKWKGTSLTRAAVSGWFARAIRRGELVESTIPGLYYLQGHSPPSKTKTTEGTGGMSREQVGGFDVVNGPLSLKR